MKETIESLQLATLQLTQEGPLKERLLLAYSEQLLHIDSLRLPEFLREDFDALHAAMHSAVPQPRECQIRASVRKMSNAEVRTHAALVVRVFAAVARGEAGTTNSTSRGARTGAVAPVVSLFAEA
jgi:hypothetical protein